MKVSDVFKFFIFMSLVSIFFYAGQAEKIDYDIVIVNARVMDPLSRADYMAHLGIKNGKIQMIVPLDKEKGVQLEGRTILDAAGRVVAPGFIDVHSHEGVLGLTMDAFVKDGRTTMIGGNCGGGPYPLDKYFRRLEQDGIVINYATYSGHSTLRHIVGARDRYTAATREQIEAMKPLLEKEMQAGSLGVSYGIHYDPGSSYEEILALAKIAAKYGGMTAAHGRYGEKSHLAVYSLYEMIRLTKDTGIPHQYSHIGSMLGYGDVMDEALDMLEFAQSKGLRILADIYSYDAWNTGLSSAILDEGCFERFNGKPEDLEVLFDVVLDGKVVMEAGDRFTQELFDFIRPKTLEGKVSDPGVIGHVIHPDKIKLALQSPFVVAGSDGVVVKDPHTKKPLAHPRASNNFARFLGYWVREQGLTDLMTALFKTSTQTAIHLGLTNKGRIAVGADADIVIFDPATIIDRGEYGEKFATPPAGIAAVIVNGVLTVKDSELIPGAKAGKVIRRTWRVPGYAAE